MNQNKGNTNTLNYKNDPLLMTNNVIINTNSIETINLYGAILNKNDLKYNKKGALFKKCPYVYNPKGDIRKLIKTISKNDKNFIRLRRSISSYLNIKAIRKDSFRNWIRKDLYPFPVLRIVCILSDKSILKTISENTITDFCNHSGIVLPLHLKDIRTDFTDYFIGLHLGDGTLSIERWKIVEGDERPEYLEYSLQFLTKLRNKLKSTYALKTKIIYKLKNKNAYELTITNKWFCNFLHYVLKLPFGKKGYVEIPYYLLNEKVSSAVIRGLFDTDGGAESHAVTFANSNIYILNYVKQFLNTNKISYTVNTQKRKNLLYTIKIAAADLDKFANLVGFLHPKKQNILMNILKKPSLEKMLIGIKKENFKGNSFNLNKIRMRINNKQRNIKLPNTITGEILYLAKYIRIVDGERKVRIVAPYRNKRLDLNKINSLFKKIFGVNIRKNGNEHYAFSARIELFFKTFFRYEYVRKALTDTEINQIKNNLEKTWTI